MQESINNDVKPLSEGKKDQSLEIDIARILTMLIYQGPEEKDA